MRTPRTEALARYLIARPAIVALSTQHSVRKGDFRVALACEIRGCRETANLQRPHQTYAKPRDVVQDLPPAS